MNSQSFKGYFMILLSAIAFGSYGVWSRLIGSAFDVFTAGWVRSVIIFAVLVIIALSTKSYKKVAKADIKWIVITVIFGIFAQAPLYYAFNNMDIGTATLLFYGTFVITSYVIGKIFLNEKITKIKLISLFVALCGLLVMFGFSLAKFSLLALLLAVLNGVASGGVVTTTKRSTHKFSSVQMSIFTWGGVLVTHLPLALLLGEKQVPLAFNGVWLSMLIFALAGLVGFWLVVEGFKYVEASIGGLIGLLEIIAGVFFGMLFFHEQMTISIIVGGSFIIFAAMLPDVIALVSKTRLPTPIITETPGT